MELPEVQRKVLVKGHLGSGDAANPYYCQRGAIDYPGVQVNMSLYMQCAGMIDGIRSR